MIDTDAATQPITLKLTNFDGIDNYITDADDEPELRGYIVLRLITLALYDGSWRPNFVSQRNLDFDYSDPQNVAAIHWVGNNESQPRREWINLCKSWNNTLKIYYEAGNTDRGDN